MLHTAHRTSTMPPCNNGLRASRSALLPCLLPRVTWVADVQSGCRASSIRPGHLAVAVQRCSGALILIVSAPQCACVPLAGRETAERGAPLPRPGQVEDASIISGCCFVRSLGHWGCTRATRHTARPSPLQNRAPDDVITDMCMLQGCICLEFAQKGVSHISVFHGKITSYSPLLQGHVGMSNFGR